MILPKYRIDDGILPKEDSGVIQQNIQSSEFPWYLQKQTIGNIAVSEPDVPFFSHRFVVDGKIESPNAHIPLTILHKYCEFTGFNYKNIIRIHAGLTTPQGDLSVDTPSHVDNEEPHYVLIYYVNNSNGATTLHIDGEKIKISPVCGRFVLFNGIYYHSGSTPSHGVRIVFNYNLKV